MSPGGVSFSVCKFAARLPPFLDGRFQNLNTTSPLPLSDRVNNQCRQSPDKLESFHPRPARLFQDGVGVCCAIISSFAKMSTTKSKLFCDFAEIIHFIGKYSNCCHRWQGLHGVWGFANIAVCVCSWFIVPFQIVSRRIRTQKKNPCKYSICKSLKAKNDLFENSV